MYLVKTLNVTAEYLPTTAIEQALKEGEQESNDMAG